MSLRMRLFVVFGGLLALLTVAQWWWMRTLSQDLTDEAGALATEVGNTVARVLVSDLKSKEVRFFHVPDEGSIQIGSDQTVVVRRSVDTATDPDAPGVDKTASPEDETPKEHRLHKEAHPGHSIDDVRFHIEFEHHEDGDPDAHSIFQLGGEGPPHLKLISQGPIEPISISSQGFQNRLQTFFRKWLLGTLTLLGGGLLLAAVIAHRISAPLRQLAQTARKVGDGELGIAVAAQARGEVGQAIEAFNSMSNRLAVLEQERERLKDRQHLSELGEVARGLAHSLRNPLNALGLSVEELATRGNAPELADTARRQIRRIDRTLRSFLALSSAPAAQGDSNRLSQPVDLLELAQDVALEALQDGSRSVSIDVQAEPDIPAIDGIEAELRAVVQALLINAADASPEGARVTLRLAAPAQGFHRLEIEDRGPGLPPEIRERLFTPHLTTKAHGSGMGLFLAQRIVSTRYGGDLQLEDRPGGGTVARVRLMSRIEEAPRG